MERKYIVSDSPWGGLLFTVCFLVGMFVGGAAGSNLVDNGTSGLLAFVVFLSVTLVFQVPAIVFELRNRRLHRRELTHREDSTNG
jgi:hypothetical protein